jgi:hypothetical protein
MIFGNQWLSEDITLFIDNYFCLAYSCFFFLLPSRDPKISVEVARWPRFAYEIFRALVSYWHPPKLILPTRLHSNTCSLLTFFYLLETLELHLVAEDCYLKALLGVPSLWWNLQLPPLSLRSPFAREPAMYSPSSTHMKFPNKNARSWW